MHEVLVNRLGGLSLPRKSVVRLTDRPDMTSDVYHGRKRTTQRLYCDSDVTVCLQFWIMPFVQIGEVKFPISNIDIIYNICR